MLSSRRSILLLLLLIQLVFARVPINPVSTDRALSRHIIENGLPFTEQTHEVLKVPNSDVVIISQMSNSVLVKATVNDTGYVQEVSAFQIGKKTSGLHGLAVSTAYPGKIWITLQNDGLLLLIDPRVNSVMSAPKILKKIHVPGGGLGPHYVGEYGDDLWVSLKDSNHVLRVSHRNYKDFTLYPCLAQPIFVAKHPINGMFYASQDASSSIMRIDPVLGITSQMAIPPAVGNTPVGLIAGPHGIWFALAGDSTHGTGTVGFIDSEDKFTFHKLTSDLGKDAALLHLAFDLNADNTHVLWLLSSSIINPNALDMIFKTTFSPEWSAIKNEEVLVLPTQHSKAHRIIVTPTNVFATELSASRLVSFY
ncbi:hypothetical protein BGZ76_000398 [Entomortierella beljakovae]|nr:hypothetical protein BGZ76_000398 [Entomortierella beljakovae]